MYSLTARDSLDMGNHALARMKQVCGDTGAGMVYSDYYEKKGDAMALIR